MTDITKHEWDDDSIVAESFNFGQSVLLTTSDVDGMGVIQKDDSRALAEYFGLLPHWMTREEFEDAHGHRLAVSVHIYDGETVYQSGEAHTYSDGDWTYAADNGAIVSATHVMPINCPEPPK